MILLDVRCKFIIDGRVCNRLLGRIDGKYEIKCPKCKSLQSNLNRRYNDIIGDGDGTKP